MSKERFDIHQHLTDRVGDQGRCGPVVDAVAPREWMPVFLPRIRRATDRGFTDEARLALWAIVDSSLWSVEMVNKDYDGELRTIVAQLEADLQA